jgi:PAS domain S-box-containing protein
MSKASSMAAPTPSRTLAAVEELSAPAAMTPGQGGNGRDIKAGGSDFRVLVEGISNGVLVHRNFKPLYANAACAQRVGFASGDEMLLEPTLLPFLPAELHARALRRHARLLAGEAPGPAQILRCLTRDGESFWVEASERRIDWNGEAAVLVSLNDVTEQVQMRRSEMMLREAVDNLSDSFILYDSNQRVVLTNHRFHQLFPFLPSQTEIVGRSMHELVEASVANNVVTDPRVLHDRDAFVEEFIADRLKNRITVSEDTWPDGHWDLVKEQHTQSGGFLSVRTDITERKKAEIALRDHEGRLEQALAERSAQLKGILANIAQGVTVTAPDMTVLLVNQGFQDIFGLPDDLAQPGVHLSEYVRHGLAMGHYSDEEIEAAGGPETFVEARLSVLSRVSRGVSQITLPDGRFIEVRQQRLPDGCIVSTYNNITDRVRTEQELQLQREKVYQNEKLSALGGLLAGVSHELNNPLSVVIGQAALLESMAGDGALAERAVKVRVAADRCAKIVKTFLSMARKRPAARRAISLNDLVEDVLELVTHQLGTIDVVVTRNLAPGLPPVSGDPDQLSHVLLNLFINAQQALAEQPKPRRLIITTAAQQGGRQVSIAVRDNGPGIPDEIRSRIFDPFFTTKPIGQGTGVGLSVCHGMVSAHGGSITADNASGGGAVFTVLLPAGDTASLPGASAPETRLTASKDAPRQILVVDDEPDITGFLVEILEAMGHEAEVAASGQEALSRLAKQDYDVIICDLRMPNLDGPGLYAALKETKPHLLERIVFATGDLLNETTERFLKVSGRPCIEKPFMPSQIRELVDKIAGGRGHGRTSR